MLVCTGHDYARCRRLAIRLSGLKLLGPEQLIDEHATVRPPDHPKLDAHDSVVMTTQARSPYSETAGPSRHGN
jgi:hypothetical protein